MKPTLVVLAAGMGSRYGGLKQMDAFGPNGESIIDYSIYDAIEAGFQKVVFIIRSHFQDAFMDHFGGKLDGKIEVEYVAQELDMIPDDVAVHPERSKPWGTAHAVAVAKKVVNDPFAVINADDFYGRDAYDVLIRYFNENQKEPNKYCLIGYFLKNTLSDHGTVNRGVCAANANNELISIEECVKIKREQDGVIRYGDDHPKSNTLDENAVVSMNMFGFMPSYFDYFDTEFRKFLLYSGQELKSEFYIPTFLDTLIKDGQIKVEVLTSESSWFGVTYQDDKPVVVEKITKLIESGAYPATLWA